MYLCEINFFKTLHGYISDHKYQNNYQDLFIEPFHISRLTKFQLTKFLGRNPIINTNIKHISDIDISVILTYGHHKTLL